MIPGTFTTRQDYINSHSTENMFETRQTRVARTLSTMDSYLYQYYSDPHALSTDDLFIYRNHTDTPWLPAPLTLKHLSFQSVLQHLKAISLDHDVGPDHVGCSNEWVFLDPVEAIEILLSLLSVHIALEPDHIQWACCALLSLGCGAHHIRSPSYYSYRHAASFEPNFNALGNLDHTFVLLWHAIVESGRGPASSMNLVWDNCLELMTQWYADYHRSIQSDVFSDDYVDFTDYSPSWDGRYSALTVSEELDQLEAFYLSQPFEARLAIPWTKTELEFYCSWMEHQNLYCEDADEGDSGTETNPDFDDYLERSYNQHHDDQDKDDFSYESWRQFHGV